MNVLISRNHLDGVSDTFAFVSQATVYAMGLQPGDEVHLSIVLVSSLLVEACVCPPGRVTLPTIADEVPLRQCGAPVILTRDNPFVVLNAPQHIRLRAKLVQDDPNEPLSTQLVWHEQTSSLCCSCQGDA